MKSAWRAASALTSVVRTIAGMSLAAARQNKKSAQPPRSQRWRFIGLATLLAGAFLLPSFAAQAQIATTSTITSSENPSHAGDAVTLTATVSSNGNGVPTGTVQFDDILAGFLNNTPITLTQISSDTSQATLTISTLTVGTHDITFLYSPSGNFTGGNAPIVDQQVLAAGVTGTTTTLVSSQNPSEAGQSVTFTATVTADSGSTVPTGTVSFVVNGNTVVTTALNGSGQATFSTSSLPAGQQSPIGADYNATSAFANSSETILQTVTTGVPTTVAVAQSPNPSTPGQTVTFTVTVAPASGFTGTPTGTVTITDFSTGSTKFGPATLSGGVATITAAFSLVETHNLTATYTPDAGSTFASGSLNFQQIVSNGTATTATLTSAPNPSTTGNPVTFTFTVKPTSGSGTPTGNVTFTDNSGGGQLGIVTLSAGGGGAQAILSNVTSLTAGSHNITATYPGDGTFEANTASVTQTVNTRRQQARR